MILENKLEVFSFCFFSSSFFSSFFGPKRTEVLLNKELPVGFVSFEFVLLEVGNKLLDSFFSVALVAEGFAFDEVLFTPKLTLLFLEFPENKLEVSPESLLVCVKNEVVVVLIDSFFIEVVFWNKPDVEFSFVLLSNNEKVGLDLLLSFILLF